MRSSSSGGVNSGGVQNTVSRMVWPASSGSEPGDQWLSAATRENAIRFSGLCFEATKPFAKTTSAASTLSWLAAIRASRPATRSAAILAVPATAAAKRLA